MVPVCRLCVSSTSEIIHIFGEEGLKMNIVPKIHAHLPIKVTELDILPLTICMVCVNKLETFHEFVIMCLESDAKLKRQLAPSDEYEHVSELDISNSNNSFSEVGLKTFEEAPELSEKSSQVVSESSQGEKFTEECEYPNVEDDFDVNDILLEEQDEIQTSSQVNNHKVIVVKPEKKKKFPKKDFLVVLKMDGQNQLYENKYDTEDKLSMFVLTEHIYQHTNEKPYRCSECSKTFRTNSLLKQHSVVHSNIRHYECDACSKRLTRKSYLISHLNLHIYNNSCFTCRICARQFETLSDLHAHREFHTSEEKKLAKQTCRSMKPQKCEICGKTLFNKTTLRHHMMTHEDNKPNHCPFCKKTFAYKSALEVHIRVHTGEKPYTCMICGVGFYTKNYLLVHERLHTGERPFQCDVCNKDFRSTYSLNQHKKTHSNSRPFKCPYCSQGFKRRHVLQDHVRIHTKEKPFICKNCGNGYFQQSYCKKHEAKCVMKNIQSQSSARTQFSCLFCSENFDEEDKFHQHILSFHDMQENFGAVHDNMTMIQEEDTAEGNNGVTNELLLGQPLLCDFDPA